MSAKIVVLPAAKTQELFVRWLGMQDVQVALRADVERIVKHGWAPSESAFLGASTMDQFWGVMFLHIFPLDFVRCVCCVSCVLCVLCAVCCAVLCAVNEICIRESFLQGVCT